MRPRILVLPVEAVVIALLTVYKLTRTYPPMPLDRAVPGTEKPAPLFELLDQHKPSELVRLVRYAGRQRVVIVFFDGKGGADRSPVLETLRREFAALHGAGIAVLAVSTALPQENRKVLERIGPSPFPLLSDPDLGAHRAWGRVEESTGKARTGVFLLNRAGNVAWSVQADAPQPVAEAEADPTRFVRSLLERSE